MPVGLPNIYQSNKFLGPPWGGVNNSLPDEQIAENEWSDSANYQPDITNGKGICKRLGLTTQSTAQTATCYSFYEGKLAQYCHFGTEIKLSGGSNVDTGQAALYDSWASYAGYDFRVNGTNARKTVDGLTFTPISNIPTGAKYVAVSNNFVYCAGHSTGVLRWADYGTLETWTATNSLTLTQNENDDVSGLADVINGVLVMCARSFYIVVGSSTIRQQVSFYSKQEGCNAARSIVVTPYGVFWWTKSGLCWMKPDYSLDYPMLRKCAYTLSQLNREYDAYVHGIWDKNEQRLRYWLFNGVSQTTCNLLIDYYPKFDAFFSHTGPIATMSASGAGYSDGKPRSYAGGYASSTYLYYLEGATDNGTNISAYLESKREAYDNSNVLKRGRIINLTTNLGTSGNVIYKAYIDNEGAVSSDNTWTLTPGTGIQDNVIGLNRQHYKIKHRIEDTLATQTFMRQLQHDGYIIRSR